MYCKNNIFAVKPSTGQVARWAFVKQTAELRTGWCGRESSEVAFLPDGNRTEIWARQGNQEAAMSASDSLRRSGRCSLLR